jgi:hypothetical protein
MADIKKVYDDLIIINLYLHWFEAVENKKNLNTYCEKFWKKSGDETQSLEEEYQHI